MLCQLSYRGRLTRDVFISAGRGMTLAHLLLAPPMRLRPTRTQGSEAGWVSIAPSSGRGLVIRYLAVLAVGYVLGTKAGRRRYEQIAGTYKAVTESPAAKAVIDAGRRKIADRVSPDEPMVTLTEIDHGTTVIGPEAVPKGRPR